MDAKTKMGTTMKDSAFKLTEAKYAAGEQVCPHMLMLDVDEGAAGLVWAYGSDIYAWRWMHPVAHRIG